MYLRADYKKQLGRGRNNIRQISVRNMEKILKSNGFSFERQNGSHRIWAKGDKTISVPSVTLKGVIANRIIKENCLLV